MNNIIQESIITCPKCNFEKREVMPTDACQYFYECTSCHEVIKALPGDCCVYCSFGTVKCPPIQQEGRCC
ncbi:MAG: GDCCVxC domain-containing (seleno)protein [Gammaproteobacteria bacterium]